MRESKETKNQRTIVDKILPWATLFGSIATITLAIYGAQTKARMDEAEQKLKEVQAKVAEQTSNREDLKEKVARYTWVRSLFPDLIDEKDEKRRNFTVALLRQILAKQEAEDLFSALQASSTKALQAVGSTGLNSIQKEQSNKLIFEISQINASTSDIRKRAVQLLLDNHKGSPEAIRNVLDLYSEIKIDALSSSGIINGLVFLSETDPGAWSADSLKMANELSIRLKKRNIGPQTKNVLDNFEKQLAEVRKVQGT